MTFKPANESHPLKTDDQSWSEAIREYMDNPDNKLPDSVQRLISGEGVSDISNDTSDVTDYETSDDDEINHNIQPDFVHAGYHRQVEEEQPPVSHDFSSYWRSLPPIQAINAHNFIQQNRNIVSVEFTTDADPNNLNVEQRLAYDIITTSLRNNEPLHMFVNGTAGSGKSYLIKALRKHCTEEFNSSAVEVCAPTGTAAFNISGKTIHSVFNMQIPLPKKELPQLKGEALLALQEKLQTSFSKISDH